MFSIGILGFIVWSWMASTSLYNILAGEAIKIENGGLNFTIGWNSLTYKDTFYSLNALYYTQSAGNLNIQGSSENIRKNNYDLFIKNYSYFFKINFSKDDNWLSWFIGFIEGDGALLCYNGRSYFIITQKDPLVLLHIQETLKFGVVKHFTDRKNNRKYSRFIIADNKGIFLFYLLFNGNLVFYNRINQLRRWNHALINASRFDFSLFYTKSIPILQDTPLLPSLTNAWLSGFTDAEGCFSVTIIKENNFIRLRFILDQLDGKDVLDYIGNWFCKKSNLKSKKNDLMYRLTISCNNFFKIEFIRDYFTKFPLKTSKAISLRIFLEISDKIQKPLKSIELSEIKEKKKIMNKFIIENNPTGYSNKS